MEKHASRLRQVNCIPHCHTHCHLVIRGIQNCAAEVHKVEGAVTGHGPLPVRHLRERGRAGQSVRFRSHLIPKYSRWARDSCDESLWRYLDATCSGNLVLALDALIGEQSCSLAVISSDLRAKWSEMNGTWKQQPLPEIRVPIA